MGAALREPGLPGGGRVWGFPHWLRSSSPGRRFWAARTGVGPGSCPAGPPVPGLCRGRKGSRSADRGWPGGRAGEASSCTLILGWGPLPGQGAIVVEVLLGIPVSPGMLFSPQETLIPCSLVRDAGKVVSAAPCASEEPWVPVPSRHLSPTALCPRQSPHIVVPGCPRAKRHR